MPDAETAAPKWTAWGGRVLTAVPALMLGVSGVMKVAGVRIGEAAVAGSRSPARSRRTGGMRCAPRAVRSRRSSSGGDRHPSERVARWGGLAVEAEPCQDPPRV